MECTVRQAGGVSCQQRSLQRAAQVQSRSCVRKMGERATHGSRIRHTQARSSRSSERDRVSKRIHRPNTRMNLAAGWMGCHPSTGHCGVPQRYRADPMLGHRVANQRLAFYHGTSQPERVARPNRIRFQAGKTGRKFQQVGGVSHKNWSLCFVVRARSQSRVRAKGGS